MERKGSELFQLGLLALVVILLCANGVFFLRLQRSQTEILKAVRSLALRGSEATLQALPTGTPAPDFRLISVAGDEVSLEQFRGQRVLLIFSSTTCPACDRAYPAIVAFHRENPDLNLLMISRGKVQENQALIAEKGLSFPVLGWDDSVASAFQVPATPFAIAIDESGRVAGSGVAGSAEALERLLSS